MGRYVVWSQVQREKGLTKDEVRAMLPKVGTRLSRVPAYKKAEGDHQTPKPEPCTVVQVHRAHLWYMVRFDNGGWLECYKPI